MAYGQRWAYLLQNSLRGDTRTTDEVKGMSFGMGGEIHELLKTKTVQTVCPVNFPQLSNVVSLEG